MLQSGLSLSPPICGKNGACPHLQTPTAILPKRPTTSGVSSSSTAVMMGGASSSAVILGQPGGTITASVVIAASPASPNAYKNQSNTCSSRFIGAHIPSGAKG